MNKRPYSQILDDAARDRTPAGLDLTPQIMTRIQKGTGRIMKPQMKVLTAVLLVLLAFVVLFFTVPGVAAAIQKWFGYVPGVGLVREGQIRVLAAPVTVTRDGVTVTVEQVLLDTERTVLTYKVDGIPGEAITTGPELRCPRDASLRLPDGTLLDGGAMGGDVWDTGYEFRAEYPIIPSEVDDADLVIFCLFRVKPGMAPENWEIPLHFVPAPPDMTAFPVIEISTPTLPAPTEPASGTAASEASEITLSLDRAIQMDDGYLIYATLHWQGDGLDRIDVEDAYTTIHLLDANGKKLPYEYVDDENTGMKYDERQVTFALKTPPVEADGPLTIVVDAVAASLPLSGSFVLDLGPSPEPGKVVELNKDVKVGDYSVRVVTVTPGRNGYSFEMVSDTGVLNATTIDLEHPVAGGGGGGGGMSGIFSSGFSYVADELPDGPVTITIGGISVIRRGPWQAQWTPPAASTKPVPTHAAACLNASSWNSALEQHPQLPAGLAGKVTLLGPSSPGSGEWLYFFSNLDGSDRVTIPDTHMLSFSPDGSELAYDEKDGIYILDLATDQKTHLPGTQQWDFNSLWSPDGSQIVFMRGNGEYDLYVVNADGSGLRRLTNGGSQEWPIGWMPDGQHLLYSVPGRDNTSVNFLLDVPTGGIQEFPVKDISAISPDGQTLVIQENAFGGRYLTYISGLDGSNRTLLADSDIWALIPVWSPDGQWLIFSVSDTDTEHLIPTLVRLEDCTIIPLTYFSGQLMVWAP